MIFWYVERMLVICVCVSISFSPYQNVQKYAIICMLQGVILSQVRELITLCERTMKAATIAYFQLQHTVSAPAPVQFQTLCENCRGYEPGMQYSEFVRRLPPDDNVVQDPFSFEAYTNKHDDQK